MSNADIFVEMIRLGEQIGDVTKAMMHDSDYFSIGGATKAGKKFNITMTFIEEEKKDA